MYAEKSPSWFDKLVSCCGPPSPRLPRGNKLRRTEKDVAVWSEEPAFTPPPSFGPHSRAVDGQSDDRRTRWPSHEQVASVTATVTVGSRKDRGGGHDGTKKPPASSHSRHTYSRSGSSAGGRRSLSSRRRLRTSSSLSLFPSRRPQISAPTNFRHLHSETFAFPSLPQEQQLQQYQYRQLHFQKHQEQYEQQFRQQYQQQYQQRPPSFQPIEFSHLPSPLLTSFERGCANADIIKPLPRAHTRNDSAGAASSIAADSVNLATLDRSYSTMSFHLPRRPVGAEGRVGGSVRSRKSENNDRKDTNPSGRSASPRPPAIPQRSRLRSHSSPAVESMVERIASAMIEMEKLQAEIDSVIERQSIYASSRPSTAYGQDFDPLPAIPAMPAAAPSFAERLSTERPKTAPPRNSAFLDYGHSDFSSNNANNTVTNPASTVKPTASTTAIANERPATPTPLSILPLSTANRSAVSVASVASAASAAAAASKAKAKAAAAAATAARSGGGARINGQPVDVPLAPPLPLVLRPPLRKKKSFSRVSTWLFHPGSSVDSNLQLNGGANGMHGRDISFDSVTNLPRPVTEKDGFYQCVVPSTAAAAGQRTSLDSVSTVDTLSTWTTEREEAERRQLEEEEERDDAREQDADEDRDTPTALTTTWSPGSSPVRTRQDTPTPTSATTMTTLTTMMTSSTPVAAVAGPMAEKPTAALLPGSIAHRPQSVGVAF